MSRPDSGVESWDAFVRAHEWLTPETDVAPPPDVRRHITDQAIVSGEL
ncbi:hypothetical protein EV383_2767 [Pseudonocardia sediminis]|uniref:Uncharacterized protein n=1 Tax=Pseudonocardia sediminis TaxID=1397368 RepID=A0A4V2FQS7_PSEST|nr:hypothetical protein [Pseudonocardia sediminis]RZT85880.1 hypothetical protein EV383_2767 [Pseudonocardia sediminis]